MVRIPSGSLARALSRPPAAALSSLYLDAVEIPGFMDVLDVEECTEDL